MRLEIARLLPSPSDSPNELYLSFLSELTTDMESVSRAVNSCVGVGRDARTCRTRRASCVAVGRTYAAPFEERPGRASSWFRARLLQILVPGPSALSLCSSSSSFSSSPFYSFSSSSFFSSSSSSSSFSSFSFSSFSSSFSSFSFSSFSFFSSFCLCSANGLVYWFSCSYDALQRWTRSWRRT